MDVDPSETPPALTETAEVVIDPRLSEVWSLLWGLEGDVVLCPEALGGLLRLAYLQGYCDARDEGVPGLLFAELGVRAPVSSPKR